LCNVLFDLFWILVICNMKTWVYKKNIIKRDVCVCVCTFLCILLNYKNQKKNKRIKCFNLHMVKYLKDK
jgi:hypothetical protein